MKHFFLILLFVLIPLSLSASEKVKQQGPKLQQEQSVPEKTEKKSPPPVKSNFQPTERIKADTVVAFPADI